MPKIIVVLGPTASGKSDLAVALARKLDGEVISADSRQVYRGMDIGTGKITKKEIHGIPHHLLDVVSPRKQFTVAEFKKLALQAVQDITTRGKLPIICGGTGHYVSALLGEQQIPEIPPNPKLRSQLEKKTTAQLFILLQKLDSRRAAEIDRHNPRRLIRAIEIAKEIGRVPQIELRSINYEVCKIGIKIPNEILKERIKKRIDKWFKQGLIKEVKNLHTRGLSWKRMSEIGLEYRLVSEYLQTPSSQLPALKSKMFEKTWQYAKRQMTWFKKDKEIRWLTVSEIDTINL